MLTPKKYFILRSLGYRLISEVVDSETGKPRGIIIKKIDTEEQFEVCFTAGCCKPYLPDELKFLLGDDDR